MKEAAGEANITVITIVLVALVMAAGAIIIPQMLSTMAHRSACTEAGGTLQGNRCMNGSTVIRCSGSGNSWSCG